MEPELPEVKVIAPEKELEPPSFQPTPVQPEPEGPVQPDVSGLPEKPEADIPGVNAQVDVAAVMDGFGKIIDDVRASKNVNLNEPIEPPLLGQQNYERPQQFVEDPDEGDEIVHPFQLSLSNNAILVKPGFVRCYFGGANYINLVPQNMDPAFGVLLPLGAFVYLRVISGGSYFVRSVTVVSSNSELSSMLPESYLKLGGYSSGTRSVFNYVNTSVEFNICGYSGDFIPFS
jgi:hypothetical protein